MERSKQQPFAHLFEGLVLRRVTFSAMMRVDGIGPDIDRLLREGAGTFVVGR